jgi:hypothetical protein
MEIICSICCCGFIEATEAQLPLSRSTDNEVYSASCGHLWHKNCILKWIQKSKSCPDCRSEINSQNEFHKVFFNVNIKCDEEDHHNHAIVDEEKMLMQKRTHKLTKYIKCVTKELGNVELKFEQLKLEIAKKDQEIQELRNMLNVERLCVPLRRQTLK